MTIKKKKGSSMIIIVIMFAVLITIGITTLSLLTADYQRRIVSSKKTQNLYASDSGINVVSGAIQKVVEQAMNRGNEEAKNFLASDLSAYTNPDGSINKEAVDAEVSSRFKTTYKDYITSYLNDSDKKTKLSNGIYVDDANNDHLLYDSNFSSKPTVTLDFGGGSANFTTVNNKELLNIKVTSSFSKTPLSGETSNLKKVTAVLTIADAEYNKTYGVNSQAGTIKVNPIWKNAIAIDGNMKLKNSVDISGNVFVKGNPETVEDNNKAYIKYNGGITIGADDALSANPSDIDENKVTFNNDVVTGSSFNINGQNRRVNIKGNLYAGNVYIGKTEASSPNASNCELTSTGAVYTINDLALNAKASKIDIDKYYGINDITLEGMRPGIDKDVNSSSSIIINTDDIGLVGGSTVKVRSEAIIMGSAYVNTATPYQTGESVAIKGNYMAYTQPIPDNKITDSDYKVCGDNNVTLRYYDPLSFACVKNGDELTVDAKAKYIELVDILKLLPGGKGINKGGISLPTDPTKLLTTGIALNDGQLVKSNQTNETSKRVIPFKESFATNVYEMGNDTNRGAPSPLDVYDSRRFFKAVFDGVDNPTIKDSIQQESARQVIIDDGAYNRNTKENDVVQFISDRDDAVILGEGWETSYFGDGNAANVIKTNNMPVRGVIITKKNVKVYGKVDFKGTIIAGGDFIADDGYKKTFKSDENYTQQPIIAKYYKDTYSKIFNYNYSTGTQVVTISNTVSSSSGGTGEAVQSDLVKINNWKIVK